MKIKTHTTKKDHTNWLGLLMEIPGKTLFIRATDAAHVGAAFELRQPLAKGTKIKYYGSR